MMEDLSEVQKRKFVQPSINFVFKVSFFFVHRTALSQLSVLLLGFMMTHIPVAPMFNGAWLKY